MQQEKKYIAVDLGAESGRVMLGTVTRDSLALEECYRFANGPVEEQGSLRWDFERLFSDVKTGLAKTIGETKGEVAGIAVDSWGVDFGLLDADSQLLENPYHYRDSRTNGMMEKAFELVPKRDIYEMTGLQFLQFNTIYQLLALRLTNPDVLARSRKLLFMADLVAYFLCGRPYAEYTLASTSQLMDARTRGWSRDVFKTTHLPLEIMPDVISPGTIVGQLRDDLCDDLQCKPVKVIAAGSHDTASAVAAVPAEGSRWAYLSSGTWSLMGIESTKPLINDVSFEYSFTNEGGVEGTIRFLKNIMGLWLLQECRRQWQAEGRDYSYEELTKLARQARPFGGWLDPNYNDFLTPGDMPAKINNYLVETGQEVVREDGQMARLILESLALEYRRVMHVIERIVGEPIEVLHIVGGGTRNTLLCEFTANAVGKRIVTGPVEATAAGNILLQARATGQIASIAEARRIVRNSFELKEYQPRDTESWDAQHGPRG